MAECQDHRMTRNQMDDEVRSTAGDGNSAALISTQDNGPSSSIECDQFKMPNRTAYKQKDFRNTPKYHDQESYVDQRHHYIGTGVFNANNIDDLPPRYRTKVLNAYEWLAATFPQSNMTASELIALDTSCPVQKPPVNSSYRPQTPRNSQFPQRSNTSEGRHENLRTNHDQSNSHNVNSNLESSYESSYSDQKQFHHRNSNRDSHADPSESSSLRNSSRNSYHISPEIVEATSNDRFNSRNDCHKDSQSSARPKGRDRGRKKPFHEKNSSIKDVNLQHSEASSKDAKSSDSQSIHSKEQSVSTAQCDKSIPNAHFEQTSKNDNCSLNKFPSNQNFQSYDRRQERSPPRNSFKSITGEKTNKFSDKRISHDTKHFTNATKSRNNQENVSNKQDYNFSSNKADEGNQEQTNYPPGKRFNRNKRDRNLSNNSSQSSLSKHSENSTDAGPAQTLAYSNRRFPPNDQKDSKVQSKNSFKGRQTNTSNSSYEIASFESVNVNSMQSTSPSKSSSKRSFSKPEQKQNNYEDKRISSKDRSSSPIMISGRKDILESAKEIISDRRKATEENRPKHLSVGSSTDIVGNSMSYQNGGIHQKFSDRHSGMDIGERNVKFNKPSRGGSQPRYSGNSSLPSSDSGFRRNIIQDSKAYNRPNSQNLISSAEVPDTNMFEDSHESTKLHKGIVSFNAACSNSLSDFNRSGSRNSFNSKFNTSKSFDDKQTESTTKFSPGKFESKERSGSSSDTKLAYTDERESKISSNAACSNFSNDFARSGSRNSFNSKFNTSMHFDDKKQIGSTTKVSPAKLKNKERPGSSSEARLAYTDERESEIGEVNSNLVRNTNVNRCEERGFFVSVNVSDSGDQKTDWDKYFSNALKHHRFRIDPCCKFTDSWILSFEEKELASKASQTLKRIKHRKIEPGKPHLILVGNLKYHRIRPCDCQDKMVQSCLIYFKEFSEKYIEEHQSKMAEVEEEIRALNRRKGEKFLKEQIQVLRESLTMLRDMEHVFRSYINKLKLNLLNEAPNYLHICKLKSNFMRECQSFERCLPIYSRKDDILQLLYRHSVTVVSAETGSGKSTQLAEYLLQSQVAERGTIICTQPRKIAALSIANYVCGKIGSAVGKLVGYDIGTEKKYDKDTKIIYMTDYALLRKFLRNRRLKGISCVIIDEAHERTLHTDLLLGLLKECVKLESDRLDLRVVITSATIDPLIFVRYFDFVKTAVIDVPGRAYPVEVVWLNEDVEVGWNYLQKCVETAVNIHRNKPEGDILVFLTSPSEIDEAILLFKDMYSNAQMPLLMSLHGKSDLQEQKRVFEVISNTTRKIIFATNAAETSLTIPGIKYVIDCGRVKEMTFFAAKNKNCLVLNFINKSSAEQRKGRAGRTQPGVCYRMYSKKNFKEMADRVCPEILRTSLQGALLKIYELGLKPARFDFVESPSKESIAKSLESLELLDLVQNESLTKLGKEVVALDIEPRLAKLVLQGIKVGIGYEMVIIAAMVREAGRLFVRYDDIKEVADKKKIEFCQETGDLCTYLEVYKRYCEIPQNERYKWAVDNYLSSKALSSAEKTIRDILITLQSELSTRVLRRYNSNAFKVNFENILFDCFSENLCMYSGHPKVGYFSFILNDSLYIHPSSSVCYLKQDLPHFLVFSTLMQTTQNFLMDVTPIAESVVNNSYHKGYFKMSSNMLKTLRILPKVVGPFGDMVLRNHIIGKSGSNIVQLEVMVEKLTRSRNFKIDVIRDKGTIVIYSESRFHEKISQYLNDLVKAAHSTLAKEEDIVKITDGFLYMCIGSGGIVNDIVMPGEFREIVIENLGQLEVEGIENFLKGLGSLQNLRKTSKNNSKYTKGKKFQISATFSTVAKAMEAKQKLSWRNVEVKSIVFIQESCGKDMPIYRLQLSWSRSRSDGTGWVEFESEADCICASGSLSTKSFCLGKNFIRFTPSNDSIKQLSMRNLPPIVEKSDIEKNLLDILPKLVKWKSIHIKCKPLPAATNEESLKVKEKLALQFSRFAAPSKIIIDVKTPASGDPLWRALVYFVNSEDGEKAFNELCGKVCFDSVPVQFEAIRKSHLLCKKEVFTAVKGEIEKIKNKFPATLLSSKSAQDNSMVNVEFSCKSMQDLLSVQKSLIRLFRGYTIEGSNNKKFTNLFTVRGQQAISSIEKLTNTLIRMDAIRKVISVYGPYEACIKAKEEMIRFAEREVETKKIAFDLKNSGVPKGFLKSLYLKFGFDLQGMIVSFGLEAVTLDTFKGTLTLNGSSKNLRKVEERLEEICSDLYNKNPTVELEDGWEECPICLDPLSMDFYRLENCGHAFCKECVMMQIESKIVPIACVKKDCGKLFFVADIKTLLSRGNKTLQKVYFDTVLQHHVSSNLDKVRYCPIPSCGMVYRISNIENQYLCAGCQNTICTHCHSPFHYGMSCDMYKMCAGDEDYFLKLWMAEESHLRKLCPKCQCAIEKNEGCNHMQCLNCLSHMCWLCLELFPTGDDVYLHLPYCPNNQNRN